MLRVDSPTRPAPKQHIRRGRMKACATILAFTLCSAAVGAQDDLSAESAQAKQAMDAGRFTEAAGIYRELVAALPENPGLRLDLGLALHLGGDYRAAAEQFQAALRRDPSISTRIAAPFTGTGRPWPRTAICAERTLRSPRSTGVPATTTGRRWKETVSAGCQSPPVRTLLHVGTPPASNAISSLGASLRLSPAAPRARSRAIGRLWPMANSRWMLFTT